MKYKVDERVRVNIPAFHRLYGDPHTNVWHIDHIKTQLNGYPSLYVCYNVNDKHKLLFHFLEKELDRI